MPNPLTMAGNAPVDVANPLYVPVGDVIDARRRWGMAGTNLPLEGGGRSPYQGGGDMMPPLRGRAPVMRRGKSTQRQIERSENVTSMPDVQTVPQGQRDFGKWQGKVNDTDGRMLAEEGLAWSRTSAGRGRDPTHNKSILERYQNLTPKEQVRFDTHVKRDMEARMDKPDDWTSEPRPMSRDEAILSQKDRASIEQMAESSRALGFKDATFKNMRPDLWNRMSESDRSQWLRDAQYHKWSPQERNEFGRRMMGQPEPQTPKDYRMPQGELDAARDATIGKMQQWGKDFRDKWEPWGRDQGMDPQKTLAAVRQIHSEFMRQHGTPPTDNQMKYLLSLARQKGLL
jgi:hypothetical protein